MNQEKTDNMNRPITRSEIGSVIKKQTPYKQKSRTRWLHREILPNIQVRILLILLKLFQMNEEERTCPKTFYEATITLIQKTGQRYHQNENYRPISLMNIDTKILNEILANPIQQHIKKIIYHDQAGFIPRSQGWFNIWKST